MELLHGFLTALLVYGAVTFGFSAEGPMWSSAPTGVWADVGIGPYGRKRAAGVSGPYGEGSGGPMWSSAPTA